MIVWKTGLKTFPENCLKCPMLECKLADYSTPEYKKDLYTTERHILCPLIEIKEAQHEETLHQTDPHAAPRD